MTFPRWIVTGIVLPFLMPAFAQSSNWHNLDLTRDSVFGISTERVYTELLIHKKSTKVIVGIIDSGMDTLHEDLKSVLWTDPKTTLHGWNFLGAETGREDVTNLVGNKKEFYDSLSYTLVPVIYRKGYQNYKKLTPQLEGKIGSMNELLAELLSIQRTIDSIVHKINRPIPTIDDFKNYQPENDNQQMILKRILKRLSIYNHWPTYYSREITSIIQNVKYHIAHGLNTENNERDTATGNADISPDKLGPVADPNFTAYHGTHVAGIIGAVRNNKIGIDGIADNVQLMIFKTVGTIRELRDISLAQAIRFAVDHGAKVINLSFGKPYTWNKKAVDDAVLYAMQKDVLLIHAAGNAGEDLDQQEHYPNPVFLNKKIANNWIEVGASGPKDDETLAANFSNYGKRDVDVFAPGVQINSTLPYNQYQSWSGTSMAAPVVSGLAALIREYYPKLTAVQVKAIIMQSVVKRDILKDKCVSGGVVNAYNALKLAATYK